MARITALRVRGYRSIGEPIEIRFPYGQPVVLVGENNAGKSNIIRALELVLGPFWPGNRDPEDHEFFNRDRNGEIEIIVRFDPDDRLGGRYTEVVWRYDPRAQEPIYYRGRIGFSGREGYISNEDRDSCACVVVEAERNLAYHLSYSSKWTLLSRLMHRFHRALTGNDAVRGDLESLFHRIKDKFYDVPEFKAFAEDLSIQLNDLVATMRHRLEVDFEAYNPSNFFHALRLQAVEDNAPRALEEMGTGEQQVLALALAHAYAKAFHGGIVLVIEEPEAHLHPLAQQWLARRLKSQCRDGLQMVITTHSPAFLDIESLEGVVLVYKEGQQTKVRQLSKDQLVDQCIKMGAPRERVTQDNILPFYASNATSDLLSGFFARAVILVEGPTEVLALPEVFTKCGLEVEREGIAILPVDGKGNLAKWYRLYSAYGIPAYVAFDNDSHDDKNGSKRSDVLLALGVPKETQRELLETKEWVVTGSYTVFGEEFERCLRKYFPNYETMEEKACEHGIDTKPFVARWVAQRLEPNDGAVGWDRVKNMVSAVRAMLSSEHQVSATALEDETVDVSHIIATRPC